MQGHAAHTDLRVRELHILHRYDHVFLLLCDLYRSPADASLYLGGVIGPDGSVKVDI
jgi:hypothetical protein